MMFVINPARGVLVALLCAYVGFDLLVHGFKHPRDWDLIEWGSGVMLVALLFAAASFRWIWRWLRIFFS